MHNTTTADDQLRNGGATSALTAMVPPVMQPITNDEEVPRPRIKTARPRGATRRITIPRSTIQHVLDSVVYLGALMLAALLWRTDGFFTLAFLEHHFAGLTSWGIWRWSVPVVMSAITFGFWVDADLRHRLAQARSLVEHEATPAAEAAYRQLHAEVRMRLSIFIPTVLFNVGTSCAGLIQTWLSGRTFDVFTSITVPTSGPGLYIPGLFISVILAFGPEFLSKFAMPRLLAAIRW